MITGKKFKLSRTLAILPSPPLSPALHPLPPVQPLLEPPLPLVACSGPTQATSSPTQASLRKLWSKDQVLLSCGKTCSPSGCICKVKVR